jgi:hypothetical protein
MNHLLSLSNSHCAGHKILVAKILKLIQFMVGMIGDATDDLLKPGIGLHTGMFRISYQRIDYRRAIGAFMTAGKEIILTPDSHGANGIFNQVVINFKTTILTENRQGIPTREHISNGFS